MMQLELCLHLLAILYKSQLRQCDFWLCANDLEQNLIRDSSILSVNLAGIKEILRQRGGADTLESNSLFRIMLFVKTESRFSLLLDGSQ
jgi:hypothetical protein